jgi:hypothetical protein
MISPEGAGENTSASRIWKGELMNSTQSITVKLDKVLDYFIDRVSFPETGNKLKTIRFGKRIQHCSKS